MRSWINKRTNHPEDSHPAPDSPSATPGAPLAPIVPVAAIPAPPPTPQSGAELVMQLFRELRQVQAAFTAGRELVKSEFDLLQHELSRPKPDPGILHKAVDIIRHKVMERGEITLSNAGQAQLTRIDELVAQLAGERRH